MSTVILCNQLEPLKAVLKGISGPISYISFVEPLESRRICNFLQQLPNAQELSRTQLFRQRSEDFRKQYIQFMGHLNSRHHSLLWWAMPFTNKNPLATDLCRNTSYFLLIVSLLRSGLEQLVIVTGSPDVAAQVEEWGRTEGVKTINALKVREGWKRAFQRHTPAGPISAFLKATWIWSRLRGLGPRKNFEGKYIVIASLLHPQAFAEPGRYRDVYFGRLVDEIVREGKRAIVFGLLQERWRDQIPRLKSLPLEGARVVSVESYLSLRGLLKSGFMALQAYFRPPPPPWPAEIGGVDVSTLVRRAILHACRSGSTFTNLKIYHASARFARTVPIARCLYPYENRSWEKMFMLGIRSSSPETRIVGYQHASVTLSHTNFILGNRESHTLPLPDAVVTTGPVVKEWLERDGNYPEGIFNAGCALRQSQNNHLQPRKRREEISRVLVALATSLEEYVNTLVFLERAFDGSKEYDVQVRPHPTIPLESALRIAPLTHQNFYSPSTGSLADDLQWADVVLYASSTVGMEAVSLGIPAIYIDLGNFLDTDPMFGWNDFKWSVSEPSELKNTIRAIEAIPDHRFREIQKQGHQYVSAYLSPVTPSRIRTFLEV